MPDILCALTFAWSDRAQEAYFGFPWASGFQACAHKLRWFVGFPCSPWRAVITVSTLGGNAGGSWGALAAHALPAMSSHLARPPALPSNPRLQPPLKRQRCRAAVGTRRPMGASGAVAEATKPLTKADLVAYLASGCKPRDKWR